MSKAINIMSVVGARPNFMKAASIMKAIESHNDNGGEPFINQCLVHTGQHYDEKLSQHFFDDLCLFHPKVNLEVGSGSHALQTAEIIRRFEPVLMDRAPDILVVVGDVNSTIACALVASKISYCQHSGLGMNRPLIAHVEAGLRSGDRSMPEEINRILTDALSDILFVTEEGAIGNLVREGIPQDKVFFVGNVMIDTLHDHLIKARRSSIKQTLGVNGNRYGLVTLHRPSNVDAREALEPLVCCLNRISREVSLLFPMHPRTRVNLEKFGLMEDLHRSDSIKIIDPLGYLDFLNLLESATVVLTDSGGIQEETTALGVPCVTLRENTERPITVTSGTNYLVGTNHDEILKTITEILCGKAKKGRVPPLWDGDSGKRIIAALLKKTESILTKGTDSVQSNRNIFPEPNDSAYEPSDTKCP